MWILQLNIIVILITLSCNLFIWWQSWIVESSVSYMIQQTHSYKHKCSRLIQTLSDMVLHLSFLSFSPSHTNMLYKFKAQLLHLQFSADFALSADQWSLVAHLIPLPQSVFLSLSCFRTSPLSQHILSHCSIFTFPSTFPLSVCWLRSAWGQMLMWSSVS